MIYLVSVFREGDLSKYRTWGYFFDQTTAMEMVKGNITDIFEFGYYDIGVVVPCEEGLMSGTSYENVLFYRYDPKTEQVSEIVPTKSMRYVFYGL